MENKGIIGKMVKTEDLYKIANIIAIKALKKMESKGNMYASNILSNRTANKDIIEDLVQEVVIVLLEDNYIVGKNAFLVVNNYLYNNVKKIKEFEKISIDAEDEENLKAIDYISYLAYNEKAVIIPTQENKENKSIMNALDLTARQTEVLDIFSKTQNTTKTAELLGISKQAVNDCLTKIRTKTQKLNIKIA